MGAKHRVRNWIKAFGSLKGSIKLKLVTAFLLFSLVPAAIIVSISSVNYISASEEKIGSYSSQLIVQTSGKLDVLLENVEDLSLQIVASGEMQTLLGQASEAASTDETLAQQAGKIEDIIGSIISSRNEIIGVNIILHGGKGMVVSGEKLTSEQGFFDSEAYARLSQTEGQPVWQPTYINEDPLAIYSHVVTCSRRIRSVQTGKTLGYLLIGVKEFALADMYSYLDLGPNGQVFVTDENGHYVSNLNKNLLTQRSEFTFVGEMISMGENAPDTVIREVDGSRVLIAHDVSSVTGWDMFYILDYSYVMDTIMANIQLTIIIVCVLFVVSVIIALLLALSISRPIEALSKTMKRVEDGDLSVEVKYDAKNEIGTLYHSFNTMISEINALIEQVYQAEILKQKAEINALQSQINPHFLYNTLAMIDGIAVMRGQKDISRIAETLGNMFRYSLSGLNFATLSEEIEQACNYLIIQKYFKKDHLAYHIKVDPEVETCIISKLLLQPIIENAIIHGAEKSLRKCEISIDAKPSGDDALVITISDNGAGIESDALYKLTEEMKSTKNIFRHTKNAKRYHIGLGNIYWRIKSLYGDEFGLFVRSEVDEGTTVTLLLPRTYKVAGEDDGHEE